MNDKDKRNIILIMVVLILQMAYISWLSNEYFRLRRDVKEFIEVFTEGFGLIN